MNRRVYALAASAFLGLAGVTATVGIGTASADCVNATGGAQVDCNGMLHSSTKYDTSPQVVNGQGTNNGGTQGTACGADPGVFAQSVQSCGSR